MKAKHVIVCLLVVSVLAYSCSAPYQVSTNVKIKYTWQVSSVTVDGDLTGVNVAAPVFEDVTIDCLRGSMWSFFEEGSGNYIINNADTTNCLRGMRKITWEVVTLKGKSHYLQFYRYNAPKGILTDKFTPYIAEITDLSKSSITLKYPIKYHNKTGNLIITLTK